MDNTLYNIGKNYILSYDSFNLNTLNHENILDFIRGYIELNSKLIMPNSSDDSTINQDCKKKIKLSKNISYININYPVLILLFRKVDKLILDKFINYINSELHIQYTIDTQILTYNKIKYNYKLTFTDYHVLNILSKLYNSNINPNDIDEYLYNIYIKLSNYKNISFDSDNDSILYLLPKCKVKLLHNSAIIPTKKNASDIGYDITIIKRYKTISNKITIYDTGIQLIPQFGYYFELIPKFNLSISGYILGNSIGVINPISNKKNMTLLVTLIKVDKSMPDIQLPFKCCKILLKEMTHFELSN